ncbi:MAG: carbohydrate kinase family protein [Candidatus Paceibacterota bacterium]
MDKEIDFLGIGDVTTDAFIRLKDAEVTCDINQENCKISLRFGDKVPYESVTEIPAVGNSPNAAVSAARLGLKSAIMTDMGDDDTGRNALEVFNREGIDTSFIKTHPGEKTNYHYVLWFNDERTILIKHTEFNYDLPANIGKPKWIYLSSLGENSVPFHHQIASYLKDNPEIKLAFQPGTFQIKLGPEELGDIYKVSALFFCNVQEAKSILGKEEADITELVEGIRALGPKMAVITDGPAGAYAGDDQGIWHMPIYPDPKPPVDRTGAGDSFASTFTSAIILGKTIPEALTWGPINSMSVVQNVGAQAGLLSREKLEEYLAEAPENYRPDKIN